MPMTNRKKNGRAKGLSWPAWRISGVSATPLLASA